jgi:hypothetical protein
MKKLSLLKVVVFIALFNIFQISVLAFLDPNGAIERRIKSDIENHGLQITAFRYIIRAPFLEERDYRLWTLLFVFVFKKVSLKNFFLWLVIAVPTFVWAFSHNYPWFYQMLIFTGGLFNGGLIIYFYQDDRWQGRLKMIVAPIIAHTEVNLMIIGAVILRNGLI